MGTGAEGKNVFRSDPAARGLIGPPAEWDASPVREDPPRALMRIRRG